MGRFDLYLETLFESDKIAAAVGVCAKLIITIIIGAILIKIAMILTKKWLKKSGTDPSVFLFIRNAVRVICIIILVSMCLGMIGVPMSTVIAVLGAAGAAIALALKDSLANIAGGMMIIVTKPFSKDDLIDVGNVSGQVENIDLFLTTLKTFDNKTITIPNGLINTSILINHSKETLRRVDCTFSIGYGSDITKAKEILAAVCDACPQILKEPEPLIGVANHGESAIILDTKAWCETDDYWDVKYFLEENVKIAFDEHDIDIPYPHMDVYVKKQ
ncbi:MAG: mechanosensitive ion channel family protein [Bacillota bacterium]|nr:mechanosensitive ion channel family protein [Bacillota bacterium]